MTNLTACIPCGVGFGGMDRRGKVTPRLHANSGNDVLTGATSEKLCAGIQPNFGGSR